MASRLLDSSASHQLFAASNITTQIIFLFNRITFTNFYTTKRMLLRYHAKKGDTINISTKSRRCALKALSFKKKAAFNPIILSCRPRRPKTSILELTLLCFETPPMTMKATWQCGASQHSIIGSLDIPNHLTKTLKQRWGNYDKAVIHVHR